MSNQELLYQEPQPQTAIATMVDKVTGEVIGGFERSALANQVSETQAGTLSTLAREEAEIRAAVVLAKRFPRSEMDCYAKILHSCQRASFAKTALYRFPRGGQEIEGPSIDLARECARCWGNTRTGYRVVSDDDERIHIKGFAFDLETNNYIEVEDKFAKLIQRKNKATGQTQWIKPDERDLRELVNRRAAICVRNAILQLMPPDVVNDASAQAKSTMVKAAGGEMKTDRESTIKKLVMAFSEYAVTVEMIEDKIGHAVGLMNDEEMADLRAIYKSILDGQAKREEFFRVGVSPSDENASDGPEPAKSRTRKLAEKLGEGK